MRKQRVLSYLIGGLIVFSLLFMGCASAPEEGADPAPRCPQSRASSGVMCAEIVRYARDPASGQCCRYDSVCATPSGWKTFTSRSACEGKE